MLEYNKINNDCIEVLFDNDGIKKLFEKDSGVENPSIQDFINKIIDNAKNDGMFSGDISFDCRMERGEGENVFKLTVTPAKKNPKKELFNQLVANGNITKNLCFWVICDTLEDTITVSNLLKHLIKEGDTLYKYDGKYYGKFTYVNNKHNSRIVNRLFEFNVKLVPDNYRFLGIGEHGIKICDSFIDNLNKL